MDHENHQDVKLTDDGFPACGTRRKQDLSDYCKKRRGWGTDHLGWGHCRHHGGNSPNGRKFALKEMAAYEMEQARNAVMGMALDVDPMDALLWCVRITAGEVAYATQKVHALTEEDELVRPETEVLREGGGEYVAAHEVQVGQEELNLWIKVRQQAVDRLAKFSKMSLDAGIAERAVRIAEGTGEQLASAIRSILVGLELTYEQELRAPDLVRDALQLLEGVNPTGQALLDQVESS